MRMVFFNADDIDKVNNYLYKKYKDVKKTHLAEELNVSRQTIYYALGNKNQSVDNIALKIKKIVGIL